MTSKQQPPEVEEISVLDLSERIYQGDGVAIYLTTRPLESSDDLLFASVDSSFGGGALGVQVSQQSGIPLPEHPPEGGGYILIPDENRTQSLVLIQTVGLGKAPADNLTENLRAFADADGIDVERIWVPFMGTGAGGLTYHDSGAIICTQLLQARAAQPASMPLTINLALPRNTAKEEFSRLAAYLEGFLTEMFPAAGDPVAAETRKLLDRVIHAQLKYPDRTIDFELTEVHWPISEDTVIMTKSGLEASDALREFRFTHGSGPDGYLGTVIDLSSQTADFKNAHLVNLKMSRSKSHHKPQETVFAPVEPPQSKAEITQITDFMSNSVEFRDFERLSFRLVFDQPLSDSIHTALKRQVKRTIEDLGGTFQGPARGSSTAPNEMPDQFHSDHALTHPDQDELGRDAIAGAIAKNVGQVWNEQMTAKRPFAVHLSGRWGSGKSSILTFLRAKLKADTQFTQTTPGTIYRVNPKGWVVVDYNAWQMQNAGPAWWTLLTAVREQGYKDMGDQSILPRLEDWAWRNLRIGWAWLAAFLVAALLAIAFLYFGNTEQVVDTTTTETVTTTKSDDGTPQKVTQKVVETKPQEGGLLNSGNAWTFVVSIVTALGSLGALAKLVQGWSKTTTETAEAVRELQSNPTAEVKARYKKIIGNIERPVAVFIDDLDRCEANFVVELLESLQTAYADTPVLYVVAADRNWIVSAFNQNYKDFKEEISKPGTPLGYLFVKKIFQLSVPVPDLVPDDSTRLAEALLQTESPPKPPTKTVAEREREIEQAAAKGDVQAVTQAVKDGADEGQVLGGKAIEVMTNPENQKRLRHQLLEYTDLFDANPRSIKRLINALTFRLGYAASSGAYPGFDVIARWTILSLRFPYSADLLCEAPARISEVFAGPPGKDEVEFPNREIAAHILDGLTKEDIEKVAAFG